jgi:hypothetical protein
MVKYEIVLLITFVTFFSCQKRTFDMQTLERENYRGKEIKTEGYYYAFSKTSTGESSGTIFFLYQNGVFLYLGSPKSGTIKELDNYVLQHNTASTIPDAREFWGVFQIEQNQVSIERWLFSSGRNIPSKVFQGQIVNDTTMSLKLFDIVETWKFRAFSAKPDSTNAYVK